MRRFDMVELKYKVGDVVIYKKDSSGKDIPTGLGIENLYLVYNYTKNSRPISPIAKEYLIFIYDLNYEICKIVDDPTTGCLDKELDYAREDQLTLYKTNKKEERARIEKARKELKKRRDRHKLYTTPFLNLE